MILISTSKGDIRIELDTKNTPVTANNFLQYVNNGFYNNTVFHRVINGFMIQGGGMTADLKSKETLAPIVNEAKNATGNVRGSIAMARTNDPHSATSQFFINVADNAFLNYSGDHMQGAGYCVFGHVVDGMDVVDQIKAVSTGNRAGHSDVPVEDVIIYSVTEEK